MIDFDKIVLAPNAAIFARPITVNPIVSQPAVAPYSARGIWKSQPVDVQMEDGIMSSQMHTLDVRLAEFPVPIVPGDTVLVDAFQSLPRIGVCEVEDTGEDGQGMSILTLKIVEQ